MRPIAFFAKKSRYCDRLCHLAEKGADKLEVYSNLREFHQVSAILEDDEGTRSNEEEWGMNRSRTRLLIGKQNRHPLPKGLRCHSSV